MNHRLIILFLLIALTMSAGLVAAGSEPLNRSGSDEQEEEGERDNVKLVFEDRKKFDLAAYRGKVLVVELGAVGCPLSGKIYEALLELREEYGDVVEFVRVDYGQSIEKTRDYYKGKKPNIHVIGDPSGKIGKSLPSQAYPTLYLFGKWSRMRFMGGLDPAAFRSMVNRLSIEKKVNEKNFFFKRVLGKGDTLRNFTLTAIEGAKVTLDEYRRGATAFVLVFGGTGCPISRTAVETLNGWFVGRDGYDGLSVLVVNLGKNTNFVKQVYERMNLSFRVLAATDGKLAETYGIDTVPTVFVADKTGRVHLRSLWNPDAVKQEVDILLGKMKPENRKKITQQGSG